MKMAIEEQYRTYHGLFLLVVYEIGDLDLGGVTVRARSFGMYTNLQNFVHSVGFLVHSMMLVMT